jgi:shikimate dehydrogenase
MRRACVIGWPIEQSRSPLIHNYWIKGYGLDGLFSKEAVEPAALEPFIRSMASNGISGCSLTVPHKEAVYALADIHHASANAVGAANTIWHDRGRIIAANTDTYGYMAYLGLRYPDWNKRGAAVSIIGAGGSARAIVYGFLKEGVSEVRVFNRSPSRAIDLVHHFGPRVKALAWDERSTASREVSVLVNTTTLGMRGAGDPGIDVDQLHPDCIVSDIVYVPLETALLKQAKTRGLKTLDGLGMLLHQAVPAFEAWFGVTPAVTDDLYNMVAATIEVS